MSQTFLIRYPIILQQLFSTVHKTFVIDAYCTYTLFTDNQTCLGNQFQCSTELKCIPQGLVCNGYWDCGDGSDEQHCGMLKFDSDDCYTT